MKRELKKIDDELSDVKADIEVVRIALAEESFQGLTKAQHNLVIAVRNLSDIACRLYLEIRLAQR